MSFASIGHFLVAWLLLASAVAAQEPVARAVADSSGNLPRVFLDCQATGCDADFLRTELRWLNFIRERTLADVYIMVTERTTAGGGREFTATFVGQGPNMRTDTAVVFARQGSTQDELRRVLARTIAQGMLPFVRGTPLSERLNVTFSAPPGGEPSPTRGARDRWNLWVYRIGFSAFGNGDRNYKQTYLSASLRASRTTDSWKLLASVNGSYAENRYLLSAGQALNTYQHSYGFEVLAVSSAGPHWSRGIQLTGSAATTANLDFALRVGPAVEYDVVPYSESTRHQIVLRYGPGFRFYNYRDSTIFNELAESRTDHRLTVATDIRRPWGNLGGSLVFSQYLHDLSKRSVTLNLGARWRIVSGLEFNVDGYYSRIADQLALPRGAATDEEILLRLKRLQTSYSYFISAGLSYTFGSVFQNVVNPRFTQSTYIPF
ncbi:MAG TPA: hypothetical protein VNL96_07840 [Gemmatimonadaceae bacterium]|nr:hypothetical protein [Gemmatimonadaceae bacterium]